MKTRITMGLFMTVLTVSVCLSGCHRGYYRRQADNEARQLIAEKSGDARWDYADGSVEIDPQSRMFDPFSQDHPPIPPDDPESHQFMHQVDGKDAYPHWHANGDTDFVENPQWRSYLPINEKGQVVLDMETAFRLALVHSPDYQQQRETLYLSALDVSLERFGFDTQLFSGFNSFLTTQGRLRNGTGRSSTTLANSLGSNGGGINFQKLGITGANFAVGIANSIVWNFAGPNTQSASSLIDFSLIQPLLRGAGRERILESLTLSERTLLANVRQMDRFRRGFYLEITTGRSAGAGPNRGGNFLNLPGAANGNAGGYMGLLQQQQQIRIQEFNVRQLLIVVEQFQAFFEADRIQAVQVLNFENRLYSEQNRLIQAKTNYQNSLDRFKQTLGLPPDLDVIIDDPFLDKFKFISDQVNDRQLLLAKLRADAGLETVEVGALVPGTPEELAAPDFAWSSELDERVTGLVKYLDEAIEILDESIEEDVIEIRKDFGKLDSVRDNRLGYLRNLLQEVQENELLADVQPELLQADSIKTSLDLEQNLLKTIDDLKQIRQQFVATQERLNSFPEWRMGKTNLEIANYIRERVGEIPQSLLFFSKGLIEFSLLQSQARSDAVEIVDVDLTPEQAIEVARCFRRDWMNARAGLVDRWRQIEFIADQLEAQVDLVFEGDIGNTGDNPFKLRYETGQLRAGFRFDAPIVRLAERNQYRQTLIQYQQAKRDFYQFRDEVLRNLRQTIRDIALNKILFEVNRKSVQVSIREVEAAQFDLVEPVRPGAQSRFGPTTAQNLSNAISGLQQAQNNFLNVWVEYEVARRNIDFDMGTMEVDEFGSWVDPGEIDETIGFRAAERMGVDLSCQFCTKVGITDSESYVSGQQTYELPDANGSGVLYGNEYDSDRVTPTPVDSPTGVDSSPLDFEEMPSSVPQASKSKIGSSLLSRRSSAKKNQKGKTEKRIASRNSQLKSGLLSSSEWKHGPPSITRVASRPLPLSGNRPATSESEEAGQQSTDESVPAPRGSLLKRVNRAGINSLKRRKPDSVTKSNSGSLSDLREHLSGQNGNQSALNSIGSLNSILLREKSDSQTLERLESQKDFIAKNPTPRRAYAFPKKLNSKTSEWVQTADGGTTKLKSKVAEAAFEQSVGEETSKVQPIGTTAGQPKKPEPKDPIPTNSLRSSGN